MFNLEQQEIYIRYKNPENSGHLENADFRADGTNLFCGDEVHLEGYLDQQKKITKLVHQSRACAICTASADMLAEIFIGRTLEEVQETPSTAITERLGIPLSPIRLKCALLPHEALKQAQIK